MKASFVDLRKKSKQIIRAINRNEKVTLFYRGRAKAVMQPIGQEGDQPDVKAQDHAAFGIWADREDLKDVAGHVRKLRKGRFDAL
jgi:hypothetical protein